MEIPHSRPAIIAVLAMASLSARAVEITQLTLSPSNTVKEGTLVTVHVKGTGSCSSWVGTSGADGKSGFSSLFSAPKPLPHQYNFTADKLGEFETGVMSSSNLNET